MATTRKYELMLILDPVRSEEQQQETLQQIEEVITKYGGEPVSRDIWGKRRMAYTISKRRDGYYALIYFTTDTQNKVLAEIELFCRIREEILRHLITLAVEGKSKGDPALIRQQAEMRSQRPGGFRRGPGGPGRGPDRGAPPAAAPAAAPAAPAAEAAPAAAPEAPAAEAPAPAPAEAPKESTTE